LESHRSSSSSLVCTAVLHAQHRSDRKSSFKKKTTSVSCRSDLSRGVQRGRSSEQLRFDLPFLPCAEQVLARSLVKKKEKTSSAATSQIRSAISKKKSARPSLARRSAEIVWGPAPQRSRLARPLARPRRSSVVQRQFGPLQSRPNFRTVKKNRKKGTCLHTPHL
jgi:hypothetical protein